MVETQESIAHLCIELASPLNVSAPIARASSLDYFADGRSTFGVSSFSVAIEDLATDFNVSIELATLGLTLYVLGQSNGPCLTARRRNPPSVLEQY